MAVRFSAVLDLDPERDVLPPLIVRREVQLEVGSPSSFRRLQLDLGTGTCPVCGIVGQEVADLPQRFVGGDARVVYNGGKPVNCDMACSPSQ